MAISRFQTLPLQKIFVLLGSGSTKELCHIYSNFIRMVPGSAVGGGTAYRLHSDLRLLVRISRPSVGNELVPDLSENDKPLTCWVGQMHIEINSTTYRRNRKRGGSSKN